MACGVKLDFLEADNRFYLDAVDSGAPGADLAARSPEINFPGVQVVDILREENSNAIYKSQLLYQLLFLLLLLVILLSMI